MFSTFVGLGRFINCQRPDYKRPSLHLLQCLSVYRTNPQRMTASLSCFSVPQGLFRPVRCISSLLFCSTGIISTQSDASLSCSFAPQGLFRPGQTRPPSLKASLPGHADQFRFICPGTEKGRMKNFRFPHVLFRSSEDNTSLSLASYIFAAICLATYTPLAEAWDSECVMPLPSPIIYRPS